MDIKADTINHHNTEVQTAQETETSAKKRGWPEVLSVFAALGANSGVKTLYDLTLKPQIRKKYDNMISDYTGFCNVFSKAGYSAFKTSGLPEKGVTILSAPQIEDIYYATLHSNTKKSIVHKYLRKAINGDIAFYEPKSKRIFINTEKRASSIFHEMGHALNYNSNGISRLLTMLKPAAKLLPLIFAVAAIRRPKEEGEESETLLGKGLDYIKRNCVSLAALLVSPIVMEEALASIKGIKMAKNLLPKEALKDMVKIYGVSWLSYLSALGSSVLGVFVTDKIRNYTASHNNPKANEEENRNKDINITA